MRFTPGWVPAGRRHFAAGGAASQPGERVDLNAFFRRNSGMTPLAFSEIIARLEAWTFPAGVDGVVGIATGGVVPAALVAQRLRVGLKVLALNYRDELNAPRFAEPRLISAVPDLGEWRRILLVDDVYVSGRSWHAARALLPRDIDVLPFVLKGKTDFALIRDIDGCVQWPWKIADVKS